MRLKLFDESCGESRSKWHPKVELLVNQGPLMQRERDILEKWTEGLVDRDKKIVKEFQTTFHSSFWEFYLYAIFSELGFELDQSHNRPDFIVKKPISIKIEAVVANIKKDGEPESSRTMDDILSMVTPPYLQPDFYQELDEAIVRMSNALFSKLKKYNENYISCSWIDENDAFMIAAASYSQVNYGREYIYPMLALLYGLYYNAGSETYERRNRIKKPGTDVEIDLNLFEKEAFANVSAIIYSCTTTIGKLVSLAISESGPITNVVYNLHWDFMDTKVPYKIQEIAEDNVELLSDGLFIFHNPNAKKKIPIEIFESTNITQYFIQDGQLKHTIDTFPLISRINVSIILKSAVEPYILGQMKLYNRYDMEDDSQKYINSLDFSKVCVVLMLCHLENGYKVGLFHAESKEREDAVLHKECMKRHEEVKRKQKTELILDEIKIVRNKHQIDTLANDYNLVRVF